MDAKVPIWIERRFRFDFPTSHWPNVLARLSGAPPRLEDVTLDLPADVLTRRVDGKWSIQENAGHLVDLDELHEQRFDEYLEGAKVLTPADVTNPRTEAARHNERPLDEILAEFREARMAFVTRLLGIEPALFDRVAEHPRLGTPMRLVDMLYFVAEHDDHHLARIWELVRAAGD